MTFHTHRFRGVRGFSSRRLTSPGSVADLASYSQHDVKRPPSSRDPTRTGAIRRAFRSDIEGRLRRLKQALRGVLIKQDVLVPGGPAVATGPAFPEAYKLRDLSKWFTDIAEALIIDRNGYWIDAYIRRAYELGVTRAKAEVNKPHLVIQGVRIDAIVALAQIELQGATDAMVHLAGREVASALLIKAPPRRIYQAIVGKIDAIGKVRLRALASTYIVRAFNEAKLDVYEASGIALVGTIAETRPPHGSHDHSLHDAPAKIRKRPPPKRRFKTKPGAAEQAKIERREAKLTKLGLVEVLTAGDDDVCDICEGISEAGPYTIDQARSLIPAHPNCRCAFIPADEADGEE